MNTKMSEDIRTEGKIQQNLVESILGAQLLLAYVMKEGKDDIEEEYVQSIVTAKEHLLKGQIEIEIETKFWIALREIAKMAQPATIKSLSFMESRIEYKKKFFFKEKPDQRSKKRRKVLVSHYRSCGLLVLFFMLIVQIYWVVGSSLLTDTEKIPKDIFQLQKKIFTRTDLLTSAGKNVSEDIEIQNLEGEQQLKSEEEEATYEFLNKWNRGWKIKEYFKSNKNDENRNFIEKNVRIVKSARFVLNAIQTYLLPLLYGLLGAFAFVFRSLSDELKTSSFTEESVINYRLQIALGILSGLAIGWFFVRTGDETGFSIRSLSPLALAFLAGYSVELLFSIMDKLISAFSIKKQ